MTEPGYGPHEATTADADAAYREANATWSGPVQYAERLDAAEATETAAIRAHLRHAELSEPEAEL